MTAPDVPLPVPDVLGPDLVVLFCGINPGLRSAEVGRHFARPGNRFWKALHGAGFTDRVLDSEEQDLLPDFGVGITNLVARPSAAASELTRDELVAGAAHLEQVVRTVRPRAVAFLGIGAYRTAFRRPRAALGRQPESESEWIGDAQCWVLPNPSGLQARYQLPELITLFAEVRTAATVPDPGSATTSSPARAADSPAGELTG